MMPEPRVTAWWYVCRYGLADRFGTLDALLDLGLRAAQRARWEGIPEQRVAEGPFIVHTWPERVWAQVIAEAASAGIPPGAENVWDPGWPPMSSEDM